MHLIICIDDTDSKTSEKGTGAIAEEIMALVAERYDAKTTYVTRHQFLIHPDIPYTSHNSSMCFECDVDDDIDLDALISECFEYLKKESAPESDPGLCVADVSKMDAELLVKYGKECKRKVMTIESAYETAKKAHVFLDEAGGSGQGVIGAVGGVGLRYWGCDGTLKGKPKGLSDECNHKVSELTANKLIDAVIDLDGNELGPDEVVYLEKKPKVSLENHKLVILVDKKIDGVWQIMEKNKARWRGGNTIFKEGCNEFTPDVEEERVSDSDEKNCYNCLYRRWLENGILCQKPYSQNEL
ncbi:MAG: hypothetical protein PUD72_03445 [Oscillospiraceae bacterium]|nr:hypothetical protein [Oscillospiraceae bacterium]